MLSASTISSNSPEAFSPRTASSTPLSQYSNSSTPKTAGNPLTELIETEKSYMETLKIIDSQLAPLWTDTSVIDFTELLKYVHDILKANKRFCSKLTRIAANPQTIKELGDVLMQWIDDMEVPYANYSRAYISNLNTRTDVLSNPDIKQLLQDLSRSASYEITLESLFNAPVQQLKYYKVLYGRLLDSAEPGRADHKLLVKANKRIDTVMLMAQKNLPSSTAAEQHTATKSLHHHHHYTKALPVVTPIQTDISVTAAAAASSTVDFMDLGAFQRHLDSSQAKDIFNGVHVQCQPRLATPGAKIIFRDNFVLLPDGLNSASPQRVHVVLTTYVLVITQESNGSYSLMYPPIAVYDLSVNAAQVDRELIGEYIIQVDVLGKKKILLRADTKETRNKWVGIDEAASGSAALNAKPMRDIVSKLTGDTADKQADEGDKPKRSSRKSVIRKQDIVSFYTDQSGEISPLSSDESDIEDKFSLFGGRTPFSAKADRMSKTDPSVKDLPPAPPSSLNANAAPPPPPKQKQGSHLQPATSIDNRPLPRAPSPAPSHHLENSGHSRPVSPRTIEIKHTVTPVAMQATTQSSEFLTNRNAKQSGVVDNASSNGPTQQALQGSGTSLPRTSSISRTASPAAGQLPTPTRSSSFRQQQQQQQQQQQPTGGSPQLHPSGKPLPQEPSTHHSQQHHQHHPPPNPQPHYQPQPRLQSAAGPQQHTMAQHRSPQQQQQPPMMAAPQHYRSAPSSPTQRPTMMMGNVPPPINRAPSTGMGPDGYSGQQDSMRPAAAPATNNYLNVQRPSLAHHRSMEELNSPPRSPTPNGNPNSIKQTLYSNGQCEVFHWKSESWYAVDGHCLLHVRQTFTNRSCVAIQLQNTGQLYLNAWILPNTVIAQPSPTDVSLTVYMGANRENYLVHFASHADARTLFQLLQRMHQEAVQMNMTPENSNTLRGAPPGMIRSRSFDVRDLDDDPVESNQAKVPQTLRLVMQCKCKLFVQNEHSNWSSFGSVTMKISQQLPSKKMHIEIENGKGPKATKLVSASVQSRNVERISSKRITFLLINEQERTSMVYMVQIKEEETGNKIFEYLKTKNAENGW